MSEKIIELSDNLDTRTFYGVNNQNILCLKNMHPQVRVVARGYTVKMSGSDEEMQRFEDDMRKAERFCIEHNMLSEEIILDLIKGSEPHL